MPRGPGSANWQLCDFRRGPSPRRWEHRPSAYFLAGDGLPQDSELGVCASGVFLTEASWLSLHSHLQVGAALLFWVSSEDVSGGFDAAWCNPCWQPVKPPVLLSCSREKNGDFKTAFPYLPQKHMHAHFFCRSQQSYTFLGDRSPLTFVLPLVPPAGGCARETGLWGARTEQSTIPGLSWSHEREEEVVFPSLPVSLSGLSLIVFETFFLYYDGCVVRNLMA